MNDIRPTEAFCRGSIMLGSGCKRCGRCAIELAARVSALEAVQGQFAVVYDEHIDVPGDERSRLHPGHGYPGHTVTHKVFQAFDSQDAFLKWVQTAGRQYQAYRCSPVKVKTETRVVIE